MCCVALVCTLLLICSMNVTAAWMWGLVPHKDLTTSQTLQDECSWETVVRWAQAFEQVLILHVTRLDVPQCNLARERRGPSQWEDPSGRVKRTRSLWRHFKIGPRRCLPAVVFGFQMILVSGDIPHALLADSSDHSFLWQPHRFKLQQLWARLVFHTPPFSYSIIYSHIQK